MDLFSRFAAAIESLARTAFPAATWSFALASEPLGFKEWSDLSRNTPLITLGFKGFEADKNAGRRLMGKLSFVMMLTIKNERGTRHRMLGDALGPGLFPASEMMLRLMNGATLPDLGTLFADKCEQTFGGEWSDANTALATLHLSTAVEFDAAIDPATLDDFLRVQTEWTPPPDNQVLNVINVRDPLP